MLDHLGDLLRTQVLKKEKELIEKQIEEAEQQTGKLFTHPESSQGSFCQSVFLSSLIGCENSRLSSSWGTFRQERRLRLCYRNSLLGPFIRGKIRRELSV